MEGYREGCREEGYIHEEGYSMKLLFCFFFAFALLISREKTPEARPYSVVLALRITPSISLQDRDKPVALECNA